MSYKLTKKGNRRKQTIAELSYGNLQLMMTSNGKIIDGELSRGMRKVMRDLELQGLVKSRIAEDDVSKQKLKEKGWEIYHGRTFYWELTKAGEESIMRRMERGTVHMLGIRDDR